MFQRVKSHAPGRQSWLQPASFLRGMRWVGLGGNLRDIGGRTAAADSEACSQRSWECECGEGGRGGCDVVGRAGASVL